jgi:hypothetical protein
MKKAVTPASFIALLIAFSLSLAEAGTLSVTLKYVDNNGIEQPLPRAYVYLQDGSAKPPMEKVFRQAKYILGPSNSSGRISADVPEGTYYIRINRRNPLNASPLGPPRDGDYTWFQTDTITIGASGTVDLGTKIASYYFGTTITISGTVKNYTGAPLANRYVRAQLEPCIPYSYNPEDDTYQLSNMCGSVKYLAKSLTDSSGKYVIELRDPGTYYIYSAPCLGDQHREYSGNPCMGRHGATVTVSVGDNITAHIIGY